MGGLGSGWEGKRSSRIRVEDCLWYASDSLARDGFLAPPLPKICETQWRYGNGREAKVSAFIMGPDAGPAETVILNYSATPEGRPTLTVVERISLEAQPLSWGGTRWYFRCPQCKARVGKLYLPTRGQTAQTEQPAGPDGKPPIPPHYRFLCRKCHGLIYQSTLESRRWNPLARMLARETGLDLAATKAGMKRLERQWKEDTQVEEALARHCKPNIS